MSTSEYVHTFECTNIRPPTHGAGDAATTTAYAGAAPVYAASDEGATANASATAQGLSWTALVPFFSTALLMALAVAVVVIIVTG